VYGLFLTIYVVPRMSDLFTDFGNELPTVTQIVVGLSRWLSSNVIWFAPLVIGGSILLYLWSRTPAGKLQIQRFDSKDTSGRKPGRAIVGGTGDSLVATLLAGGITLVESWEIASESITNLELRRRSESILPMIREGRSFTESLESSGWMPALAIDMMESASVQAACGRCWTKWRCSTTPSRKCGSNS
jgi:type II secretory pathway component PulF